MSFLAPQETLPAFANKIETIAKRCLAFLDPSEEQMEEAGGPIENLIQNLKPNQILDHLSGSHINDIELMRLCLYIGSGKLPQEKAVAARAALSRAFTHKIASWEIRKDGILIGASQDSAGMTLKQLDRRIHNFTLLREALRTRPNPDNTPARRK